MKKQRPGLGKSGMTLMEEAILAILGSCTSSVAISLSRLAAATLAQDSASDLQTTDLKTQNEKTVMTKNDQFIPNGFTL